jgi:hypothetical protein
MEILRRSSRFASSTPQSNMTGLIIELRLLVILTLHGQAVDDQRLFQIKDGHQIIAQA